MQSHSFAELLDEVVNGRLLLPVEDAECGHLCNRGFDVNIKETLFHPDFVRFVLNFLRESSSSVVKVPVCNSHGKTNETVNSATHDGPQDLVNAMSNAHMMSTPKVRDDILNPKLCRSIPTSSVRTPISSKNPGRIQGYSEPRRQVGRCGMKPKREPLNLSDFLSTEPGYSSKKRLQKRGKRVQLTPTSEKKTQGSVSITSFSHLEASPLDAKSPVNPLFSQASRNISFDIEEEFPALSSAPQSLPNKPSRRIKPTAISGPSTCSHPHSIENSCTKETKIIEKGQLDSSNPFISAPAVAPSPGKDLAEERSLLRRMKGHAKNLDFSSEENDVKACTRPLEDLSPVKKCSAVFDPQLVTDCVKVDRLARLYSYFITCFVVPSVVSEMQFVVELLTIPLPEQKSERGSNVLSITGSLCNSSESTMDDTGDSPGSNSELLSTVMNCVYFSATVIQGLVSSGILAIFSRSTLSLVAQNQRIQMLRPDLPARISGLVEELEMREKDASMERYGSGEKLHSMSSVMFEAETDDRSNFPSDKAFHAFRKHRDAFYALIREYDEKKHDPSFQIPQHLGIKIKNLVSQVKGSATYKPFVRLFVSQMLQEVGNGGGVTPAADESLFSETVNPPGRADLLSVLRQGDPERFRRLQSRLFTATNSKQTRKTKDFLSDECFFYKEFVLCADSYAINTHLCNELRGRIADLQSHQAQQVLDDALAETSNAASVSFALRTLISSSCVLGRFLGFIVFEPYNADELTSSSYDLSVLSYVCDALDSAYLDRHELATVPWVTEYLRSAKFSESPLTSEAETLTDKLFRAFSHRCCDSDKVALKAADVLICLLITSLFDSPVFPNEVFYQNLKKHSANGPLPKRIRIFSHGRENCKQDEVENPPLDECCSDLVSFSLIYETVPALREIRSMIISCKSGSSKSNHSQQPSRKIKPNREQEQEGAKENKLQSILEAHFFRGQPSSLKRTVEFVAERCASNCVKHIRSISMLDVCDRAENLVLRRLQEKRENVLDNNSKGMLTREIVTEMKTFAEDRMKRECDEFCTKAVPKCLEDLTSCETADAVLKIANIIARKKAVASVQLWLSTRLEELVSVSVKARLTKVFTTATDTDHSDNNSLGPYEEHSYDGIVELDSVSSLLQTMKEYVVKLTFTTSPGPTATICPNLPKEVNEKDIHGILQQVRSVLVEHTKDSEYTESALSMRRLLSSSPHLRNTLLLTCRELERRSKQFFAK